MDASTVSSAMSIDELPTEEKLLPRQRHHSMSESELTRLCGARSDTLGHHVREKGAEGRKCKSDSDFMTNFTTGTRDVTQERKGGREIKSVARIVEEEASEPHKRSGRLKSLSVSMMENLKLIADSKGMFKCG